MTPKYFFGNLEILENISEEIKTQKNYWLLLKITTSSKWWKIQLFTLLRLITISSCINLLLFCLEIIKKFQTNLKLQAVSLELLRIQIPWSSSELLHKLLTWFFFFSKLRVFKLFLKQPSNVFLTYSKGKKECALHYNSQLFQGQNFNTALPWLFSATSNSALSTLFQTCSGRTLSHEYGP